MNNPHHGDYKVPTSLAAHRVGVSPQCLRNWRRAAPHLAIADDDGRLRFSESRVEALATARENFLRVLMTSAA